MIAKTNLFHSAIATPRTNREFESSLLYILKGSRSHVLRRMINNREFFPHLLTGFEE